MNQIQNHSVTNKGTKRWKFRLNTNSKLTYKTMADGTDLDVARDKELEEWLTCKGKTLQGRTAKTQTIYTHQSNVEQVETVRNQRGQSGR